MRNGASRWRPCAPDARLEAGALARVPPTRGPGVPCPAHKHVVRVGNNALSAYRRVAGVGGRTACPRSRGSREIAGARGAAAAVPNRGPLWSADRTGARSRRAAANRGALWRLDGGPLWSAGRTGVLWDLHGGLGGEGGGGQEVRRNNTTNQPNDRQRTRRPPTCYYDTNPLSFALFHHSIRWRGQCSGKTSRLTPLNRRMSAARRTRVMPT